MGGKGRIWQSHLSDSDAPVMVKSGEKRKACINEPLQEQRGIVFGIACDQPSHYRMEYIRKLTCSLALMPRT